MSATQVRQALKDGVRVVDARSVDDFAAGHLRGSVNVGFDGRFAETGGMVADIGDKIALITYPGEEQDAALRLARVGSDNAIGYLTVDARRRLPRRTVRPLRTAPRTDAAELDGCSPRMRSLLSTSAIPASATGRIPGVQHPVGPVAEPARDMADRQADRRALRGRLALQRGRLAAPRRGIEQVSDLIGGYNEWVDHYAAA